MSSHAHQLLYAAYKNKFCAHLQEALIHIGLPNMDATKLFEDKDKLRYWEQKDSTIHIENLAHYFSDD